MPPIIPISSTNVQNNTETRGRSNSWAAPTHKKLEPSVRKADAGKILHLIDNTLNPGVLDEARSKPQNWTVFEIATGNILSKVELHTTRGLINLVTAPPPPYGIRTDANKRLLQECVAMTIGGVNAASKKLDESTPLISLHENHRAGNGRIYPDQRNPLEPNEQDYDYYHTPGVSFDADDRMLPHYHVEFGKPLDRNTINVFLQSLQSVTLKHVGCSLLSDGDIERISSGVSAKNGTPLTIEGVESCREKLPSELTDLIAQVRQRDVLQGFFVALSTQGTENNVGEKRTFNTYTSVFRHAHDNMACFLYGNTNIHEQIEEINAMQNSAAYTVTDLLNARNAIKTSIKQLKYYSGSIDDKIALKQKAAIAVGKIDNFLKHNATIGNK